MLKHADDARQAAQYAVTGVGDHLIFQPMNGVLKHIVCSFPYQLLLSTRRKGCCCGAIVVFIVFLVQRIIIILWYVPFNWMHRMPFFAW